MQIQLSDEQVEFIYKELSCSSGYNLQSIHCNGELQELVSYLSKRMEATFPMMRGSSNVREGASDK